MYYFLGVVPLVVLNLWHAYILIRFKGIKKPDTISEHACQSPSTLISHRLFHTAMSVCLTVFAIFYLILNRSLPLSATFLIAGAIFDVIEVFTLNKENSHHPFEPGIHQITAWLMTLSYFIYAIFIMIIAGIPAWFIGLISVSFFIVIAIASHYELKRFWIAQMFNFALLASIVIAAHIVLLR